MPQNKQKMLEAAAQLVQYAAEQQTEAVQIEIYNPETNVAVTCRFQILDVVTGKEASKFKKKILDA